MRSLHPQAALVLLFCASIPAFSDDPCHFIPADVSRDEARVMALAGVKPELKCDYELNPLTGDKWNNEFLLFAELYQGTDCIARYRLARAVTDSTQPLKGIISVGWKEGEHQLTGVVDNMERYSPWTNGAVTLPQFSPLDQHFFETSQPESRHSERSGDFVIFPVVGIRGESNLNSESNYENVTTGADFLKRCQASRAKYAVIVYLYKGGGEDPPLKFSQTSFLPNSWLSNRLGVATAVALIIFLLYWFASRHKGKVKKAS